MMETLTENNSGNLKFLSSILIILWFTGCAISPQKLVQQNNTPKKIAIFFDGTANDEESDTNIKKLHSLFTLQKRNDIASIYIEGVGADGKVVGMATGWGFKARVREAYTFLLENYCPGDEIYIFGFSRGAYSGRVLASLLNYPGLPNISNKQSLKSHDIAGIVYEAFKGDMTAVARRTAIDQALSSVGLTAIAPIQVATLGLWDTIEALGLPDYEANIDSPNWNYGDQLCNIKQAFHAVAIDDDRERIFTPILLTRPHLLKECTEFKGEIASYINSTVDEVWFSGAHADVGGGYPNSLLSGVSLNWMIGKLKHTGLLPENASVPEDYFENSHDPEKNFPWKLFYKRQSRDLRRYAESGIYNVQNGIKKLKLHSSVIKRLEKMKPKPHEYLWLNEKAYPKCFEETQEGYLYIEASKCFDIVK